MMLSREAIALFRLHLERHGQIDVDANRESYEELERAGLMAPGHSFRDGRGSIYRLTRPGFEQKGEVLAYVNETT